MTAAEAAHATAPGQRLVAGKPLLPHASDASQLLTTYLYQFRSYLRTWRFLGLVVFVALISTAILAIRLSRGTDYITATYSTGS